MLYVLSALRGTCLGDGAFRPRFKQAQYWTLAFLICEVGYGWEGVHDYGVTCRPMLSFVPLPCFTALSRSNTVINILLVYLFRLGLNRFDGEEALRARRRNTPRITLSTMVQE